MAEQDRYRNWFGGKAPSASDVSAKLPQTSGAEQDRYAEHLSGKLPPASGISEKLPQASGAEQDRYAEHFSGKLPSMRDISAKLPQASGAEQDRYGAHFSGKLPPMSDLTDRLPKTSGAEQDRYAAHFSEKWPSGSGISDQMPRGSGAEQDRYGAHFSGKLPSVGDVSDQLPRTSGAEQDRFGGHFGARPTAAINATSVGLLQSAVLPSLGFHVGLSAAAYGAARYANRVDVKDLLWPAGITANAWWGAVGTRIVYDGLSVHQAWSSLGYSQKLLLTGVSAWGLRLFSDVARQSAHRGDDDTRYAAKKSKPEFWNNALFTIFLPEAISQTLVSLPLTLPFRATLESIKASPIVDNADIFHSLAVFLFSTGFALEVLADTRSDSRQQRRSDLNHEGVWSIVRHTNFIGDALIHASFPLLLLGTGLLHPIALAGPIANHIFLRFMNADEKTEAKKAPDESQDGKPVWSLTLEGLQSQWTWVAIAAGVSGAFLEKSIRNALRG